MNKNPGLWTLYGHVVHGRSNRHVPKIVSPWTKIPVYGHFMDKLSMVRSIAHVLVLEGAAPAQNQGWFYHSTA